MELNLNSLNTEQLNAVNSIEGPVCVIAGAGSGKTKALTTRIAHMIELGIKPQHILAITFTNKAAREMKERVTKILNNSEISSKIYISTFHALCSKIIRVEINNLDNLKSGFTILDDDDQLGVIKTALTKLNLDVEKFPPKSMLGFISKCKNNLLKWSDIEEDFNTKPYIDVYRSYQEDLAYYNRCDFDDLLFNVVELFEKHPEILFRYQELYKYILIDEYQDTNTAQYVFASLLGKKYKNIFVVGDVDQSIYGFRGSDFSNILNFKKDYPTAKLIKLEQNYRSTKTILEAANQVISHNNNRIDKKLWTSNNKDYPIIIKENYDDKEEAKWIVNKIEYENRYNHKKYNEISILIRTNAQSHAFEDAFINKNIPYTIIGAKKFYDRKEIKDVLAYLKLLSNPSDLLSFKRIINVPKRGIGDTSCNRIESYFKEKELDTLTGIQQMIDSNDIISMLPKKAITGLLDLHQSINIFFNLENQDELSKKVFEFLSQIGYMAQYENGREEDKEINKIRIENVLTLLEVIRNYSNLESGKEKTLENFLEYISLMSDTDNIKEKDNRVTIMTCHASKGLEYPIVFLTGFEENILPSWQALIQEQSGKQDGIEEERRLCYVAITRAKERLYLSYASQRTSYNKTSFNQPSRFIDEIPEYLLQEEE